MTFVATCSNNYSATRRPDFTIIMPVSIYHHVSYAETDSRYKLVALIAIELCELRHLCPPYVRSKLVSGSV